MKKLLYIGITALILTITSAQAMDKTAVAVVNITSIFQRCQQHIIVAKQLEHEFKKKATELQSIERDLRLNISKLQRDSSIMNSHERKALEQLIITQRKIFTKKAHIFEQEKTSRQIEERDKILNLIQKTIKKVAIKSGYEIVIDTNAIAYANHAKDITIEVLTIIK